MGMLGHTKRRTITAATAVIALGLLSFGGAATVAQADTISSGGFESFVTGSIAGQQGWTKTGAYDVNIADPMDYGITDMGNRALQMSNATTSGSFGDHAFSAPLVNEAGETSAENGGISGGVRQTVFSSSFSIRTASELEQPGLAVSISPDRGDGARMSYLRLNDAADGVHVTFYDFSDGDFRATEVATISRTAKHSLGLTMVFVDGAANDIVRVSVDGAVVHTGTSWEDYFRDVEGNPTRTVDSLLFRAGGTAAPGTLGNGFLFDDVVLASASTEACAFSVSGTTMALVADCVTDHTVVIPDGFTLDGADFTITAVDPTGGHFVGAVVQNAVGASTASVTDLTVTASKLATACDAFPASLAGIRLDGAAGSITNNTVTGLQQGASGDGCQEGNAIEVRNTAALGTPQVAVTGNVVSEYQKTGLLVKGQVAAIVTGNTVLGYGPVGFIAQNGIQVSLGATAQVTGNSISDNFYTPESYDACGLIIYQAGGVKLGKNIFAGNEKNVCNIGRGGGKFGDV